MGGTGSKQEDQIITVGIEKATGAKFIYVPFKGGGEVAVQLVGKHIDSDRQQPDRGGRAVARRQAAAAVRVRREAHALSRQGHRHQSWDDIPTCKEAGRADRYVMLRGIFMPAGVTKEQSEFYVDLLKKVRETPEWKEFMEKGAFNHDLHDRRRVRKWLERPRRRTAS